MQGLHTAQQESPTSLRSTSKERAQTLFTGTVLLFKAAPFHAIGKIGIRDSILLKAGSLDDDGFEIMKLHPRFGAEMIKSVAAQISCCPFMQIARRIYLYHQENWGSSGCPQDGKESDPPFHPFDGVS